MPCSIAQPIERHVTYDIIIASAEPNSMPFWLIFKQICLLFFFASSPYMSASADTSSACASLSSVSMSGSVLPVSLS